MTTSISSAPSATEAPISSRRVSSGARPCGKAVDTAATWMPVPFTASDGGRHEGVIDADGGGPDQRFTQAEAVDDIRRSGRTALAQSRRTRSSVSLEFNVVRSISDTARSSHAAWLSAFDGAAFGHRRDAPLQCRRD